MNKLYCTTCKSDNKITSSSKDGTAIRHKLSCGHNFIELILNDAIKVNDEIQFKKTGGKNEKYKHGNKPPNINYARKFIEYGNVDCEAAKVLFNIQDRDYDFMNQAAFLSAQAVEKYLKAFLFWNSPQHYPNLSGKQIINEFRNLSHDLIKILNECVKDNADFNKFRSQIENLNKYSLLKYPDVEDEMVYSYEGLSINSDMSRDVKTIGDFVKEIIN